MTDVIQTVLNVSKVTDQAMGDIEDGYAKLMVGLWKLRKAGLNDMVREELDHLIALLKEDLRDTPR